jgi:class 3 adenylate cyclase
LECIGLLGDDPSVREIRSATATFLFTDIEGSTQLLRSHRTEYAQILADHHRILREQFAQYGGAQVDNQGDAFFVAFGRARDAVLCAAACQRELARWAWPSGATVRVRMGIHTGEAELAAERYVGLSVHRAARISGVGHGGQILVSQTTAALLEDEDDLPGIVLKDLGEYSLKDLTRPARLYQVDVDGLEETFPPLKVERRPGLDRRQHTVVIAAVALVVGVAAAAAALYLTDFT